MDMMHAPSRIFLYCRLLRARALRIKQRRSSGPRLAWRIGINPHDKATKEDKKGTNRESRDPNGKRSG